MKDKSNAPGPAEADGAAESSEPTESSQTSFRARVARVLRYPPAVSGALIIAIMVGLALFADALAPYDPTYRAGPPNTPPSSEFLLGTNGIGQDILSRVIYGGRKSMGFGVLSVLVALLLGVPLGLSAGYFEGPYDFLVMRVIDLMMSFPSVLLAILIMALAGQSTATLVLAVGLINVPTMTRQTRAAVLSTKQQEFVMASRALGSGHTRIMFLRILPNVLGPIIVLATLGLGTAILETAGLGFLGLGLSTDAVEWGTMLSQSRKYILMSPWIPIVPGVAVSLAVLGFNLLGDGLRDILDPRHMTG